MALLIIVMFNNKCVTLLSLRTNVQYNVAFRPTFGVIVTLKGNIRFLNGTTGSHNRLTFNAVK